MTDLLEQSVIYQDILQKGEARGIARGALKILLLMLEHRFGKLARLVRKQIEKLSVTQIEALGQASFTFASQDDIRHWLKEATEI